MLRPPSDRPCVRDFSCSDSKSLMLRARVGDVGTDGARLVAGGPDIEGTVAVGRCAWDSATVRIEFMEEDAVGVATTEESLEERGFFKGFSQGASAASA